MKLTLEEFKRLYFTTITDEANHELKQFHNIDAGAEIEAVIEHEYELYCSGEFDKMIDSKD